MRRISPWILSALAVVFTLGSLDAHAQDRKPLMLEGKTSLPLKVLTRPFSNLYKSANGEVLEENLPAFKLYYVYTRPAVKLSSTTPEGWYEVGNDAKGAIAGWLKAEDVMEWKQAMCLAYTHPMGRHPVLMFKDMVALRKTLQQGAAERKQSATKFYTDIEAGKLPADYPVASKEPDGYIDIIEQFYLLPILEHSVFEIDGIEGRLLKVTAATKSGTRSEASAAGSSTPAFTDPEAIQPTPAFTDPEAIAPTPAGMDGISAAHAEKAATLKQLKIDVVYVVDLTSSMGPYVESTLKTIQQMSQNITKDPEMANSIRFGLWGYRDSTKFEGMEFVTKNFTPELQAVADFEKTLAGVKATESKSGDFPEDLFSGADLAMRESKWTDDALKIMIVIGDAPAHEAGHDRNSTGKNAGTLRAYANDNAIYLVGMHIKNERAPQFWEQTETQFRALATNPGSTEAAYLGIDTKDIAAFDSASRAVADSITGMLQEAKKGMMVEAASEASASTEVPSEPAVVATETKTKMANLGHAALVQWLGTEMGTEAPSDITAWVTDRDLQDPDTQSLEVRLLISKNELDSLKGVLEEVYTAGKKGMMSGEDFFSALQSVPSAAARGGDQIKQAKTLAETGLIPEFLADLPYKSRLMSMSNELWSSWGIDQQDEFLNDLTAKLQFYAATHDNPKLWIALNQGDDSGEQVFPLSLDMLP